MNRHRRYAADTASGECDASGSRPSRRRHASRVHGRPPRAGAPGAIASGECRASKRASRFKNILVYQ